MERERTFSREQIIENLNLRLKAIRENYKSKGSDYRIDEEYLLLCKARILERKVLQNGNGDLSGWFPTGYVGRKGIDWRFTSGDWTGQLFNRDSSIVKKEAAGTSAEDMLRGLMPNYHPII